MDLNNENTKISIEENANSTEAYSFVLSNLDNITLYNVYQICQSEKFWKDRFMKNFGFIHTKHKPEFMSWKDFSLQLLYYINKGENNLNKAMIFAIEDGKKNMVEIIISNGASSWELGIIHAAKKGFGDIVDLLREKIIQQEKLERMSDDDTYQF